MEDRNFSKKDLEDIEADSNENLALIGNNIIGDTLKAFVRIALPNIPEEGVEAIKSYQFSILSFQFLFQFYSFVSRKHAN